jgi:YD repeat-containing protein
MTSGALYDASRVTYAYLEPRDRLGGEDARGRTAVLPYGKGECVARVVNQLAGKPAETTTYAYDHAGAARGEYAVSIGPGVRARYVLNADGNLVTTDESGTTGKNLKTEWSHEEITKRRQTNGQGGVTEYVYDTRGLVTRETVTARGQKPAVTTSSYDLRCGKLLYRQDAQGRVSTWQVDPRTCDILEAAEAGKPSLRYRYDEQGRIVERVESWDTLGNATTTVAPDGKRTHTEYDTRGRKVTPAKTP